MAYFGLCNASILLTVVLVYTCSTARATWEERKKSHQLRTLRSEKLTQIAQLIDEPAQTQYFKETILKPFLIERVSDTEGNRAVREHIKTLMSDLGWHVEEDEFVDSTPFGDKTFVNVIAVHNPSATRRLTLACHYDSKIINGMKFIGATDSAVPCAIMIDIATVLAHTMSRNRHGELTLQLIFFDGEEAFVQWTDTDSLYGARHLAEKMSGNLVEVEEKMFVSQLETIDALVLLDLIGSEDTQFSNWFAKTFPLYKHFQTIESRLMASHLLQSNGTRVSTKRYFSNSNYQHMEQYGGGIQDDHIPFLRKGVPCVHLIAHPFPSVWHQASDNEDALHYPTIHDIRKIILTFTVEYLQLNVVNSSIKKDF